MSSQRLPAQRGPGTRAVERTERRDCRTSRPGRALLRPLCGLLLAVPSGGGFAQTAMPHMDILSAAVREEAPFDPATVAARTVVVEVRLAGPPSCGPTSLLAYGVLIDADLDPQTGEVLPAFAGLGVDARLSAECDPGSGLFVSEVGTVEVATDPGGETTLTITTTVADLPALEFNWIAFAQDGADLTRLPESPDVAAWTVLERNLP